MTACHPVELAAMFATFAVVKKGYHESPDEWVPPISPGELASNSIITEREESDIARCLVNSPLFDYHVVSSVMSEFVQLSYPPQPAVNCHLKFRRFERTNSFLFTRHGLLIEELYRAWGGRKPNGQLIGLVSKIVLDRGWIEFSNSAHRKVAVVLLRGLLDPARSWSDIVWGSEVRWELFVALLSELRKVCTTNTIQKIWVEEFGHVALDPRFAVEVLYKEDGEMLTKPPDVDFKALVHNPGVVLENPAVLQLLDRKECDRCASELDLGIRQAKKDIKSLKHEIDKLNSLVKVHERTIECNQNLSAAFKRKRDVPIGSTGSTCSTRGKPTEHQLMRAGVLKRYKRSVDRKLSEFDSIVRESSLGLYGWLNKHSITDLLTRTSYMRCVTADGDPAQSQNFSRITFEEFVSDLFRMWQAPINTNLPFESNRLALSTGLEYHGEDSEDDNYADRGIIRDTDDEDDGDLDPEQVYMYKDWYSYPPRKSVILHFWDHFLFWRGKRYVAASMFEYHYSISRTYDHVRNVLMNQPFSITREHVELYKLRVRNQLIPEWAQKWHQFILGIFTE